MSGSSSPAPVGPADTRGFFPLPRGDRYFLGVLILFAVLSFLPVARELELAGMALLGWLMAALMVFSPLIALIRLRGQSLADAERPADDAPGAPGAPGAQGARG